jgi:hypothetical protein
MSSPRGQDPLLGRGAVLVIPKPLPCLGQVCEFLWAARLTSSPGARCPGTERISGELP